MSRLRLLAAAVVLAGTTAIAQTSTNLPTDPSLSQDLSYGCVTQRVALTADGHGVLSTERCSQKESRTGATPDASIAASLQVGATGTYLIQDYSHSISEGITGFVAYDRGHYGVEATYSKDVQTPEGIHEYQFLIGPRLSLSRGRFTPYVRGQVGSGHFQGDATGHPSVNNSTYFVYAAGAGVDVRVARHISWRAVDYSYSFWRAFDPDSLTPYSFGSGFAYVFGR